MLWGKFLLLRLFLIQAKITHYTSFLALNNFLDYALFLKITLQHWLSIISLFM